MKMNAKVLLKLNTFMGHFYLKQNKIKKKPNETKQKYTINLSLFF